MQWTEILSAFVTAALISYLATPFVKLIAIKTNFLDQPRSTKVHAHPKPLLGGVAIWAAFLIAIVSNPSLVSSPFIIPLIAGAFVLLLIGLIDDRMGMEPNMKLLGQFLAAMVVIKSGLRVEFLNNYYLNVIFTYLWIIGITNAFNLLDNMDGLSSGIAVISGVFFGIISWLDHQSAVAGISFALAGSSLGFLKHNFPRSKIFMGDTGSLVIGYILASIAIVGKWKTYVWSTSLMIPILVLGYPIFDTTLVIVIRLLERRSVFDGGRDHSSHRLALLGLKKKRAVYIIFMVCCMLGLAALLLTRVSPLVGIGIGILAIAGMIGLGIRLSIVKTSREGRKKIR